MVADTNGTADGEGERGTAMDRRNKLENWRIATMVISLLLLVAGVWIFLDHADDSNRGILQFVAAGWTLIMLGVATFFWDLIESKLQALDAAETSGFNAAAANNPTLFTLLADLYKTGPFSRVLLITGLVLMLAAGAKGNWIDLPSVAVSIGDTDSGAEATPMPVAGPTEAPGEDPTPSLPVFCAS